MSKLGKEDLVGHLPPHGACTLFDKKILINEEDTLRKLMHKTDGTFGINFLKIEAISLDLPVFYYRST